MILKLKAKDFQLLPDGSLRIITDCESLREALNEHSPNILIDYLNERYALSITRIGKEARNGNV